MAKVRLLKDYMKPRPGQIRAQRLRQLRHLQDGLLGQLEDEEEAAAAAEGVQKPHDIIMC